VRTRNLFMKCDRLACADGLAVTSYPLGPAGACVREALGKTRRR
jgi:hypothetical protein